MFDNFMSPSEFLNSFKEYYNAIWPALIVIQLLGALGFFLLIKKPKGCNKIISIIISFLWLWDGIVHQLILAVSPPTQHIPMSILFITQGLLFLYLGVLKPNLIFTYEKHTWTSKIGLSFMIYGFLGYLIIQTLQGHFIRNGGVFFSTICPFDCYTLGLLMMSGKKTPKYIVIIPLIWALAGGLTAICVWHIWEDLVLAAAGIITASVLLLRKNDIKLKEHRV